jgi:hypothetical protein
VALKAQREKEREKGGEKGKNGGEKRPPISNLTRSGYF